MRARRAQRSPPRPPAQHERAPAPASPPAARRAALLQRRGALVNLTADERTLNLALPHVEAFLDSLPVVGLPFGPDLLRFTSLGFLDSLPVVHHACCSCGHSLSGARIARA